MLHRSPWAWLTLLAVISVMSGCAAEPVGPKVILSQEGTPRLPLLDCPEGTREVGLAPPDGTSARCVRMRPDRSPVNHGPERVWHANGAVKLEGVNDDGVRVGVWTEYRPDGSRLRTVEYQAAERSRVEQRFDESGLLIAERTYRQGELHGPAKDFFPSGQIAREFAYAEGKLSGASVEYYAGGLKRAQGEYLADEASGHWSYWYSTGKICMKGRMVAGRRDGYWAYADPPNDEVFARFDGGEADADAGIFPSDASPCR